MPRYDSKLVRRGLLCTSLLGTFTLAAVAQHNPKQSTQRSTKQQVSVKQEQIPLELTTTAFGPGYDPSVRPMIANEGGIAGTCPCTDSEGEPNCGNPDTVNGGCNSAPPVFSPISCAAPVCGSVFASAALRDTDWWRFTLAADATVTWTVTGDFTPLVGFVAQPCPQVAFIAFATGTACSPTSVSTFLLAGDYVAFVANSAFVDVPCGAQYSGTLSADVAGACVPFAESGACCLTAGGCEIRTAANCAGSGTYQGDNTNCGLASYTIATCGNALEDISGIGTMLPISSSSDDASDSGVPIGFSFTFFGNSFTDCRVSSNGFLTFDPSGGDPFTNTGLPNPAAPNNMICPFWDDFNPGVAGDVFSHSNATRFIVQWNNVRRFGATVGANTFQAILFPSGAIEFRYGSLEGTPPLSGTIGVENSDGTAASSIPGGDVGTGSTCRSLTFVPPPDPCVSCPEDTNGDGVVDVDDLIAIILAWGPCPACAADVNGDNVVDVDDLIAIILAWGPC